MGGEKVPLPKEARDPGKGKCHPGREGREPQKVVATVCKVAVKRQAKMSCESSRLDSSQLPIHFTPFFKRNNKHDHRLDQMDVSREGFIIR